MWFRSAVLDRGYDDLNEGSHAAHLKLLVDEGGWLGI